MEQPPATGRRLSDFYRGPLLSHYNSNRKLEYILEHALSTAHYLCGYQYILAF